MLSPLAGPRGEGVSSTEVLWALLRPDGAGPAGASVWFSSCTGTPSDGAGYLSGIWTSRTA